MDAEAPADRDVAEGGREVCLPDADRAEDEDSVPGLGEPETGQVGEQGPVLGEVVGLVPGVEAHGRVQPGGVHLAASPSG